MTTPMQLRSRARLWVELVATFVLLVTLLVAIAIVLDMVGVGDRWSG